MCNYERRKKNDIQENDNTPIFIPLTEAEQKEIEDLF
jgi:hypothetical protein